MPPRRSTTGTSRARSCAYALEAAGGTGVEEAEKSLYDARFLLARPVLQALQESPAVLLFDEVDRADDEFEAFLASWSLMKRWAKEPFLMSARRMINPMIVEGQVHGGVAQGVGGALYEVMAYDEAGQLLNASFMDFLMPYASEVPRIETDHLETPSPLNPLALREREGPVASPSPPSSPALSRTPRVPHQLHADQSQSAMGTACRTCARRSRTAAPHCVESEDQTSGTPT